MFQGSVWQHVVVARTRNKNICFSVTNTRNFPADWPLIVTPRHWWRHGSASINFQHALNTTTLIRYDSPRLISRENRQFQEPSIFTRITSSDSTNRGGRSARFFYLARPTQQLLVLTVFFFRSALALWSQLLVVSFIKIAWLTFSPHPSGQWNRNSLEERAEHLSPADNVG